MGNLSNQVMLSGCVGKDPEVNYQPSGLPIANFSIAAKERWKNNSGEWKERTDWFQVTAFGEVAKSVEAKIQKGTRLSLYGKLVTDTWTDKDGKHHSKTYVNLKEFLIISGAKTVTSNDFDDLSDLP